MQYCKISLIGVWWCSRCWWCSLWTEWERTAWRSV